MGSNPRHRTLYAAWGVLLLRFLMQPPNALAQAYHIPTPEEREAVRSTMMRRSIHDLHTSALPLGLPASQDPYGDIQGERIHASLRDIVGFSLASRRNGDVLWGRICGRQAERKTAEYVKGKFETFGLEDVRIEAFPVGASQWWPTKLQLSLVGGSSPASPRKDYVFRTAFTCRPSGVTPPEGIEAPVVYIGLGTAFDLAGKDLQGKIVLLHSILDPSCFHHSAQRVLKRLERTGNIAGAIIMMDLPGNLKVAANLLGKQGTGKFPYMTVGRDDGMYLRDVIEASGPDHPPVVRMIVRGTMEQGWESQNTFGLVRGSGQEYIILIAHTDGWFEGAMDNASGVAVMLELARYYSRQSHRQRRNLLFVATAGHHADSPGTRHILSHHDKLMARTVAVMNCEHLGSVGVKRALGTLAVNNTENPYELSVTNRNPLLIKFFLDAVDRYGIVINRYTRHDYAGDASPFRASGVPCLQLITAPIWYHTEADTPEHVSPQGLERVARGMAYLLDKIDGVPKGEIMDSGDTAPSTRFEPLP